jgi:hypothetical protein
VASGAAVPVVITVDGAVAGCLLGQGRWTKDQHPLDVGHWDNCVFAGPEVRCPTRCGVVSTRAVE